MVEILWNLIQGTDEWRNLRRDKVSATDAYDLLNGLPISEIIKRKQTDFGGSFVTERGHFLESEARELYSELKKVEVKEAGAILNDKYPNAMCSPDGVVGKNGLIEVKSFLLEHHEDTIENLDPHLIAQIQFQLLISERKWVDFVAYNPEETDIEKAFVVQRITPDKEIQAKLKEALNREESLDDSLDQTAMMIFNLQSEIAAQESLLSAQLEDFQTKKEQLEALKQKLKSSTQGKVKKTIELNGSVLDLSIYDTHKIEVSDPKSIAEEYTSLVEIEDCIVVKDKVYKRVPNPKLVQNFVKAGKSLPAGFNDKVTRVIRLKFNGKGI